MTAAVTQRPYQARRAKESVVGERFLVGAVLTVLLLAPIPVRYLTGGGASGDEGFVLAGPAMWTVMAAVTVGALVLLGLGLFRPTRWAYPEDPDSDDSRDLRIDMVRGLAIAFVILNHLNIPSLFQLYSQEMIGPVSGAELFVTLSGVVLGMVYRKRLQRADLLAATGALLGRALKLYRTALAVVVTIFLLTLLPGVNGQVVTTFTDFSSGESYQVYPNMERLLDYPVPGYVLRDILFLRLGPFQFNIMGFYVVMLAVAPLVMAALRRGLVLALLAVSWGLYLLNAVHPVKLLGSQFEDPFPLLTWQVLFVTGMAVGWYRRELLAFAWTRTGKAVVALLVLAQLAMLMFSWSNPFMSNPYDIRLAPIPDATFNYVYERWFERPTLALGRLLAVALVLVTLYGLLTAYWKPVHRFLGWFLVPLGQATLYVFVLHVYFALLIANVPGLDQGNVLVNTLAHGVTLAALWVMVKRRFLFRLIPR